MKKKVLGCIFIVLAIFVVLNIVWYLIAYRPYQQFENSCHESLAAWSSNEHCGTDKDGYSYSIRYPAYMSLTGNLSISSPCIVLENGDKIPFTDALIIWPGTNISSEELGVILYDYDFQDDGVDCMSTQIFIDRSGNVVPQNNGFDDNNQQILDNHAESVKMMLEKAMDIWLLK